MRHYSTFTCMFDDTQGIYFNDISVIECIYVENWLNLYKYIYFCWNVRCRILFHKLKIENYIRHIKIKNCNRSFNPPSGWRTSSDVLQLIRRYDKINIWKNKTIFINVKGPKVRIFITFKKYTNYIWRFFKFGLEVIFECPTIKK